MSATGVPPLVASLDEYNTIKSERIPFEMREPVDRDFGPDQLAVVEALTAKAGVPPADAAGIAVLMTDLMMRSLSKAGRLRGANQRHLRATIFAAWIDGFGLGLHHAVTRPPTQQETP